MDVIKGSPDSGGWLKTVDIETRGIEEGLNPAFMGCV
ncbi:hypothetical protein ES703_107820 [subsurface metagenome]